MEKRKAPNKRAPASAPAISPASAPARVSVNVYSPKKTPVFVAGPSPAPAGYLPETEINVTGVLGLFVGVFTVLVVVIIGVCVCVALRRRMRRRRRGRGREGGVGDPPGGAKDDIEIALSPLPSRTKTSFNSPRLSSAHCPGAIIFTYEELEAATSGFSACNLLGQGGFGYVHKGVLPDGRDVAVKQLKAGSLQGEREFQAEVDIIGSVHHKHLVLLLGYCQDGDKRMLVYEYIPNKTLNYHLHGNSTPVMSWETRMKIARGSAQGIAYLHGECRPKIIHRDIKAANILLDYDFEPKVADFGLAKFVEADVNASTRIMGSFGYMAPEYASSGMVSHKCDVFSFGVLLLELLTGRRPMDRANPDYVDDSMVTWARPMLMKALRTSNLDDLVDPKLQNNYNKIEMGRVLYCAALCVRHPPVGRPTMVKIVQYLEGNLSPENLYEGTGPRDSSGDMSYNPTECKNDWEKLKSQNLNLVNPKLFLKL